MKHRHRPFIVPTLDMQKLDSDAVISIVTWPEFKMTETHACAVILLFRGVYIFIRYCSAKTIRGGRAFHNVGRAFDTGGL